MQALRDLRAIVAEYGMSMADAALKWTLAGEGITCALVGTQRVAQLEQNIAAAEAPLPPEMMERLNRATDALKEKLGPALDVFEGAANDRTR